MIGISNVGIEGEKDPLTIKIEEVSQRPYHVVLRQYEQLLLAQGDVEKSARVKQTRLIVENLVAVGRFQVACDELAEELSTKK